MGIVLPSRPKRSTSGTEMSNKINICHKCRDNYFIHIKDTPNGTFYGSGNTPNSYCHFCKIKVDSRIYVTNSMLKKVVREFKIDEILNEGSM